jgi:molybdate transport system ATP-binding protein
MTHIRVGKKIPPSFSLDVEFELAAGVTVLFGAGGAGKTLLLEMLAGFVRAESGRILRDDVLLFDAQAGVHVPPRRRGCGYIPQRDALFPHLTVRQNLMFAAKAHPRLDRHRRTAEMLERFGLSDAAPSRSNELDANQRLRAVLARALLAAPKLLLVDHEEFSEPLFRQLRNVFPGPVLLATRDLELCSAIADQMVVMEAGRIVRKGTPREVLDQPESAAAARLLGYANLFECTIADLDPGRNTSRLQVENGAERFELSGPYLRGHFRGDRVWMAIRPERVRVHAAGVPGIPNARAASLARASYQAGGVRLEFAGGIFASVPADEFERQKENKSWQVEFPSGALRIL